MKHILVAEDRPASREWIRTVLEHSGYEVLLAADGEEAVELGLRAAPDLVILDLQLPRLDGFAVLRRLRAAPRFADVAFLALTANAMQGDRERALEAGFSEYITKPVTIAALRAEVARLLEE